MNAELFAALTLASFAAIGYLIGYTRGTAKGRALGWCDYHFKQIEDDKARRDRAGRFTTNNKKETS
jgi:hypothetical protein